MFQLFETFKTVYETRNFSKSAEDLFLSQSTVSKQIQKLERELGETLFKRKGHSEVEATPFADWFYVHSMKILSSWYHIKQEANQVKRHQEICRIGVSHSIASIYFPKLMRRLVDKDFDVYYKITVVNSSDALRLLEQNELELAFIEKPLQTGDKVRHPLITDKMVVVGEKTKKVWLIREKDSGVLHFSQKYFTDNNISGPFVEVNSNDMILNFLKLGIGRSIISQSLLEEGMVFERLPEKYDREFYLVVNNNLGTNVLKVKNEVLKFFQEIRAV